MSGEAIQGCTAGVRSRSPGAFLSNPIGWWATVLWVCVPRMGLSQTPSPLLEWQYSAGTTLQKLFEPTPEWRVMLGAATEIGPLYEGARSYRILAGPVINVRYRDIAFASVGEGIGANILRGDHYRAGIAVGYDFGRRVSDDYGHLHGLGDISVAPFIKVFGAYAISRAFPLTLRADIRRIAGGADGTLADLETYLPLPGSSETLVLFAGPSITFADRRYLQRVIGVSKSQASASGYPVFDAHAGLNAIGLGLSATRFINSRWLVNVDAAINRLCGSARESPITQQDTQHVVALSVIYEW